MTESKMATKQPNQQRYVLVDALRGVAAFAVLCHHLFHNSSLERPLWDIMPRVICNFCHYGSFGVQIFFVLSGFVIPHSLRNVKIAPSSLGNFLVRRQLRLDPPYWTVLILTIISCHVEQAMPWINKQTIPGAWDTVRNFFYLQNIVGVQQIVPVAWTLCLEVQFYLVFIFLLIAGGRRAERYPGNLTVGLLTVLGVASMCIRLHTIDAWFIQWWYYFAGGAICYWAVTQPKYRPLFYGYMALFLVDAIIQDPPPMLTGWCTVLLLFVAGTAGKLTTWLNFRPLQYLGRISYSLYLVHLLVAGYVLRLGYRLTGKSPGFALCWFILGIGISILAAQALYWAVESRSIRFASSLKLDSYRRATPAAAPGIEGNTLLSPNTAENA